MLLPEILPSYYQYSSTEAKQVFFIYSQIAIHGKNFCFSAKDAFMLIMRNIVR